jgi:hypothetical protein
MSIDTNYILFDDFSISEDVEKPNAATFGVTSSLPYELKLFLVSDIKGQAYGDVLDSPVLQVKLNLEDNYKDFSKTDKCITLAQNQEPTSKTYHSVDIKVLGSKIVKSDVYKATLKFVINQM